MDKKRLETTDSPAIEILANDRLYIRGWDQAAVEAVCSAGDCTLEQVDDVIKAKGDSRLDLRVPHGASLKLTGLDETTVRDVFGKVDILVAGGSLTLRDVGAAAVESVSLDLTARSMAGDLSVRQVGRFLNVREVAGSLTADFVDSHVNIKDVVGDVTLKTGGSANIAVAVSDAKKVSVKAAGVITCRTNPDLNCRVSIRSGGPISIRVGEVQASNISGSYEAEFGDGEGEIVLEADGPVTLVETRVEKSASDFEFDLNLGEELSGLDGMIGEQISGQLEMINEELRARMSGLSDLVNLADVSTGRAEEIRKRTEEKVARAQEKIRRAQERAARRIAEAQRRAESQARREKSRGRKGFSGSVNINLSDLKKSAKTKSDPVSDAERLMILNMVAENKISLEEAEALLSALEGN